jgi:putative ABC transport system permease protein
VTRRAAQLALRLSSWIAPPALRARFLEEWTAEISAAGDRVPIRRIAGAPRDAFAARIDALSLGTRRLLGGSGRDARQAARMLARSPGHVSAVVLCLGIGMTVSVVVFSLINALFHGDQPGISDNRTLARLFVAYTTAGDTAAGRDTRAVARPLTVGDFDALEASALPSLSTLAAEGDLSVAVTLEDRSVGATVVFVSPDYFPTLRTPMLAGRALTRDDDRAGAPLAAVIGYHLWRERFDGRQDIVGRAINVSGQVATIVGVAPPRFTGFQPTDIGGSPLAYAQLWLPLRQARRFAAAPAADEPWLSVVGRIDDGSRLDHVRRDAQVTAARLAAARPDARRDASFIVRSHGLGPNDSSADVLIVIGLFLSVPLSVLAIGCANAANLQLGRSWARNRELATRLALGASRLQVVRVLALEAFLLSVAAALAGWGGARIALRFIQPLFPVTIGVDARVLAFVLLLVAAVTLLSGVVPAWLSARRAAASSLKDSSQGAGVGHARLRNALVIVQVAISLALLIMSGLFVRSVRAMVAGVPPALKEIAVTSLDLAQVGAGADLARGHYEAILRRLSADPRVRHAALERVEVLRYRVLGETADRPPFLLGRVVSASWYETMGARIIAGRGTGDAHADEAVVNARLAAELAATPGAAVGLMLSVHQTTDAPRAVRVVGVIDSVASSPGVEADRAIYLPVPARAPAAMTLLVRAADPDAIAQDLRQQIASVVPDLPVGAIETADAVYLRDTHQISYTAMTVGGFGAIATILAAWGLLAVMAYSVSMRTREIGIRVAIGARPADITRMILRQSGGLALGGVIAGMALAIPVSLSLHALFIGVSPVDPIAIGAPAALLLVVGLLAAAVPARRAARIDPARTLRDG